MGQPLRIKVEMLAVATTIKAIPLQEAVELTR
jgi:hypothetical protein